MKKSGLKRLLKKVVADKVFRKLTDKKESHSKVMDLKHDKFKMQNYLKANKFKISQSEAEEIFRLRSRMTDVKLNFRGMHETLECDICNEEDESQKHLIECSEILKKKENNVKPPEYEKIFGENVREQLEVAKACIENIKIRKKMLEVKK